MITKDIVGLATKVYNDAKAANSIYPTNAAEVQLRKNYIIQANCALQCLLSQLDIAREFIRTTDANKPIKSTVWEGWVNLITSEAKLLSSLKESDKKRYKDLT
ncbi:MAG: hypothetical protein K2M47_00905 [Clostridiales bacterium]|nr:hypothetical protein [Clostridiales bacterium]MDE6200429.1 hypothetical protein [Clostridiales bacterium]